MALVEQELIRRIRQASAAASPRKEAGAHVVRSIGDDCAVLEAAPGQQILVTTDFSLEGVHFRTKWHPADSVGHRCLTRGLSDIAAMGGEATAAFLSLALPARTPKRWVDQFMEGMLRLARRHGVTLAGGDIAQSPDGILADIMVLGTVPAGTAILRSGAQPGDSIYVTGELGVPMALLEQMFAEPTRRFRAKAYPAHFYPEPQLAVARVLREKGLPSAMMDISDGLSTDLANLCRESQVGAVLREDAIPVATLNRHEVELRHALHGGDEYQLLFTVPPGRRVPAQIAGVAISLIGYITEGNELGLEHENGYVTELVPQGWQHFSPPAKSTTRKARKTRL